MFHPGRLWPYFQFNVRLDWKGFEIKKKHLSLFVSDEEKKGF
jgi:hypothetical protein